MYFRQKKETKRKISFFMAAALVFSLIPAPSMANAASTPNAKLQGSVNNASIEINNVPVSSGAIVPIENGTVTITVKANDGYMFNSADNVTLNAEITEEPTVTENPTTTEAPGTTEPPATESPTTTPTTTPTATPPVTTTPPASASPSATTSGSATESAVYSLREQVITGTLDKTQTMITFTLDDITQDILIKLSGNAVADQRKFNVTFESELAKADYKAVCDGKELKTGDSVTGGSIVSLDITAKNNCVFKEAPAVMANGSNTELILDKTNNSYSVKDGIKITSDTKVAISGTAYEKYNVTLDGNGLTDAKLEATYNNQSFDGGDVIEGDTVTLKITPNTGYAFKDLPVVKNGSENVDASAFKELSGGAYSVDVIIKSAVTLSVSGKAEAQQITDGSSPSDNANNASLSGTDFTKPEVLDNFLDAFANDKTVDNIEEIKEAINNKTAYIQAAINVTGASIEAKEEARSLIKENTSLGIDANNLSNENSAFLDIKLSSVCKRYSDNSTMSSIFVEELGDKIAVTMDLPSFEPVDNNKNRTYIVIRIHDSKAERLPDGDVGIIGERIKFFSNKFSTYIITFEDTDKESEPSGTPDDTTKPVIPPAYNPGGGSTISTPAPSTSPSTEPSKTPDATSNPAPGVTDTTKPSEKPAEPGSTDEPVATPDATKQPSTDNGGNSSSSSKIKVGKNVTISNTKYKVTSVSGTKAVQFTGAKKNAKKVVIPSTVKVSGKTFKVTSIANNALKGNKKITKLTIGANINKIGKNAFSGCSSLKSITIKSKKLTAKKTGKNAFKGINKKAVVKVPKAKIKTYKKIIKAKGAPKTVKIKK